MKTLLPARQTLPIILAIYLSVSTALIIIDTVAKPAGILGSRGDFAIFHSAGKTIVSGDRDLIYDRAAIREAARPHRPAIGNLYNPPLFALVYLPTSWLPLETARYLMAAVAIAAAGGIALLGRAWTGRWNAVALSALVIASFWPAYGSLRIDHPSLILALVSGLALLMAARGNGRASGVLIALLGLKPSLALAPGGLTLWRGDRRAIMALIVAAVVLLFLPFFLLSFHSFSDYLNLLSGSREDAFTLRGRITAGAFWMINWNGFIGRLFEVDPKPALVFPFYLATVLLMVKVWVAGELYESWLAGAVATALVIPHFLYYDSVIVLPAALALVLVRPSPLLIGLLVACHLAVNLSVYQILGTTEQVDRGGAVIYAAPALTLLLAYLAWRPQLDAWVERWWRERRRHPAII